MSLYRGSMALRSKLRTTLTVQTFDLKVTVINRIAEVSSRDLRHAASQRAVIEYHHGFAGFGEQVCSGQTCNARPDNANVSAGAFLERRVLRHFHGIRPYRFVLHGFDFWLA